MFSFKVLAKDKKSKARVGRLTTPHGTVDTPAFVPVGTQATVKSLTPKDLKEIGVQIFFGNTYHLHLRPGEDVIEDFGGLAKFMGWSGATMTDSGGFQVFSLAKSNARGPFNEGAEVAPHRMVQSSPCQNEFHTEAPKLVNITDDGVTFRSHLDGSLHNFTPEKSIEIQQKLGADIILAFDECTPYPSTYEYTKQAMERTHKWGFRSLEAFRCHPELGSGSQHQQARKGMLKRVQHDKRKNQQVLYGIVQGGIYKDLRIKSAKFISSLPFDGIAIGGVAVGESKKEMRNVLDWTAPLLPEDKPRHLLGVGEVDDIFEIVERGIDTFDCVTPTRLGRTGFIFVPPPDGNIKNRFRIDINKSKFAKDKRPLSKDCLCCVCTTFTRAYIHHLFRVKELLAYRLATYHNLYFINHLVSKIRSAILAGRFNRVKKEWLR